MLWWSVDLETRRAGWPGLTSTLMPPAAAHAWLLLFGFFPFFIFGFLFTALPNWVNGRAVPRPLYLAACLPMAAGAALFYPGLFLPGLAVWAVCLHGLGWTIGLGALIRVLLTAPAGDKRQPWICLGAVLAGLLSELIFLVGLPGRPPLFALAETLAIWGFLTPLFLAVCHRMIPFFTSRLVTNYVMVRPYGPLWLMLAACLAHICLEVAGLPQWTWPGDLLLSLLAAWFISRWGIARSLKARLLAMLHVAFVWAALAFALSALSSLMLLLGHGGLGLAPPHALGIGFFGAMLLGMASRVSLGHSGRPLHADGSTWALFWLIQVTAMLRLLPEFFPTALAYRPVTMAALLWLFTFAVWTWKYAPFYWRPRADGKPG